MIARMFWLSVPQFEMRRAVTIPVPSKLHVNQKKHTKMEWSVSKLWPPTTICFTEPSFTFWKKKKCKESQHSYRKIFSHSFIWFSEYFPLHYLSLWHLSTFSIMMLCIIFFILIYVYSFIWLTPCKENYYHFWVWLVYDVF